MRETKRFIVDNLSHCPNLKLEWLAIDDDEHAERIVRWKEQPKDAKMKSRKEKASTMTSNGDQFPALSPDNVDLGSDSDEDEDDNGNADGISKIDTIDTPFYEVWGVRIFKKEVIAGRL